ncbi:hypothetical protein VQ056_21610 [Paenibacillus sp. JTLBN-2024]
MRDGNSVVKVLSVATKAFWKYDNDAKEIYVKRQNVNDANQFPLSPAAYIHQGDTTLTVQSLKENDNIVLYLSNGTIVRNTETIVCFGNGHEDIHRLDTES